MVVEGCTQKEAKNEFWANMSVARHVDFYVDQGLKKMDAIKNVAKDRGVAKNEIYKEVNT